MLKFAAESGHPSRTYSSAGIASFIMQYIQLLLMALLPMSSMAQDLKPSGSNVSQLVPHTWHHQEEQGDLNGDGLADLVIVATPPSEKPATDAQDTEGDESSEYEETFDPYPVIAIYFGTDDGKYKLWRRYEELIPQSSNISFYEVGININERGVLRFQLSSFCSAGSAYNEDRTYVYRFQDNDFRCIGMDLHTMSRMTGVDETLSYNYLTCRRQRIVLNAFDDSIKPRETWTRLPRQPLKRLGEEALM